MSSAHADSAPAETSVTVRFWASARAAAGVPEQVVPVDGTVRLLELRAAVIAAHPEAETLPRVLGVCSALVDGTPVGSRDPGDVEVRPGSVVEFLPPFAGG